MRFRVKALVRCSAAGCTVERAGVVTFDAEHPAGATVSYRLPRIVSVTAHEMLVDGDEVRCLEHRPPLR